MNNLPPEPHSNPDGPSEEPSFEEIARALQNMMNGQGEIDPRIAESLGLPHDPSTLSAMMGQAQAFFSTAQRPDAAWEQARSGASQLAEKGPLAESASESEINQAFDIARLWLDEVTSFEAVGVLPRSYSRREWAEASFDAFRVLTEPVADSVSSAMTRVMDEQLPEEMRSMMGPASGMLNGIGRSLFAMQLGQAVGTLSHEVLSTSDIGIPLIKNGVGLVGANLASFSEGLEVEADQVRIFLALREDAHSRLFQRAPWLRSHVEKAITDYAAGISIDMTRIEEVARNVDPSRPESLNDVLGEGLFEPTTTPAQQAALNRLETLLALIEGWVDVVVAQAASRLPGTAALAETMRRRRATSGPAEQTFASLVGLQLRPRRLRDAAALFTLIERESAAEERDNVWTHPDLLPTSQDLDDPAGYRIRREEAANADAQVDAELEKLLNGGYEEKPGSSTSKENNSPESGEEDSSEGKHKG